MPVGGRAVAAVLAAGVAVAAAGWGVGQASGEDPGPRELLPRTFSPAGENVEIGELKPERALPALGRAPKRAKAAARGSRPAASAKRQPAAPVRRKPPAVAVPPAPPPPPPPPVAPVAPVAPPPPPGPAGGAFDTGGET